MEDMNCTGGNVQNLPQSPQFGQYECYTVTCPFFHTDMMGFVEDVGENAVVLQLVEEMLDCTMAYLISLRCNQHQTSLEYDLH